MIFAMEQRDSSNSPEIHQRRRELVASAVILPSVCSSGDGCMREFCLTGGPVRFGAWKELE